MKIQYMSDLHLEFRENARWLKDHPIPVAGDILVLAGDIAYFSDKLLTRHPFWDWASDSYKQVIVVPGNHEFYKYHDLKSLNNSAEDEIRHNVHFYYNKVVHIGDIDFICSTLWAHIPLSEAYTTEQGVSDFHRIIYGDHILTAADFNREHDLCLSFIKDAVEKSTACIKVVITHHVPSFQLSSPDFKGSSINGAFTVELSDYIAHSGIDYWIYGHSHRNIHAKIGNTLCLCNQLGYTFYGEESTFVPNKVLEVRTP